MPPGSLSTLAVMKPGPKTAKNATRRELIKTKSGFLLRTAVWIMFVQNFRYYLMNT